MAMPWLNAAASSGILRSTIFGGVAGAITINTQSVLSAAMLCHPQHRAWSAASVLWLTLSLSLTDSLLPVPVPGWRPGHYLSGSCSYVTFQPVHKSTTFSIDRRKRAVLPHKIGCFSRWIMCTGSWYMCICMLAVSAWERMCWLGADTNHSYFVVLFRFSSRLTRETFCDIFSLPSTWNKYLHASLPIFFFIAWTGKNTLMNVFTQRFHGIQYIDLYGRG